jgi:NAD(P)-dependent dehydrogenase (short-subunit alcohol dehydrogenase family)
MNASAERVVLITGASSGIGKACAEHLHRRGYRVYGTSRHAPLASPARSTARSETFTMIRMDVTSDESVTYGINCVVEREGRLDVVVNNAGYGLAGAVEETLLEEGRAQMETNFFGVMRVCQAALPVMRRSGGGHLINMSSLAGLLGVPFQGLYAASKFALEGFTEALRAEVRPFGIRVVLIEPGDFHTDFTKNREKVPTDLHQTPYSTRFAQALEVMQVDETQGPTPERIAALVERVINSPSPRLRYPIGRAIDVWTARMKHALPSWLVERMVMGHYRVL